MAKFAGRILLILALSNAATWAVAARQSESLLPDTTKGWISIPDVDALRDSWNQTQLGTLIKDPAMKPFVEDLRQQLRDKLTQTGVRFGITLKDLEDVYGGEVCLALIQPDGDKNAHALALLVDITDHQQQAQDLLAKVEANIKEKGGSKKIEKIGDVDVVVFTIPDKDDKQHDAYYFIQEDQLVVTDHRATTESILAGFKGAQPATLEQAEAFKAAIGRCEQAEIAFAPHVRWFIEPFGYVEVVRAAAGGRKKRGTDLLKVLSEQGFDAIEGLAGQIFLSTGEHEVLHHTAIYAPPLENNPQGPGFKYRLAANMLEFPNTPDLMPQSWVPRQLATYLTFNWKMKSAFEHSKTLVNQLIGSKDDEDIFEDIIGSLATDDDGPKVDIRKELIDHFAERATLLTDNQLPITPKSERLMVLIELNNPDAVRQTVDKAMKADPDAKSIEFAGHLIWEIVPPDKAPVDVDDLDFPNGGFDPFGAESEPEDAGQDDQSDKGGLPGNLAVTVAYGQLIVATNIDYIKHLLTKRAEADKLEAAADYQVVADALTKLGAGEDSVRVFTRTDVAYRPTYELLKQGKMPQSETLLGKLLNRLLGPEEEGVLREQQIDGSKLPAFQVVRRYLGPAGMYVRSEDNGWFASGCLLTKDAEATMQAKADDGEEAVRN